jgi:hypothetical protein
MIRTMLEGTKWSSAGDINRPINTAVEFSAEDHPDLESLIRNDTDNTEGVKEQKRTQEAVKKLELYDKGKIGEINRFTSQQMGNLRGFVENPVQFMIQSVFRKFAKGAGIVAFALIIFEAVKWIISELLKPGRLLDLRFKRIAGEEILAFRQREDQQRLRQGFSNIIITTSPRLRGGEGQIVNTLDFAAGRGKFPDTVGQAPLSLQSSGVSLSKSTGRRSGRGPGR